MVDVGLRFALHSNAPGKLLLAYLPPEQQKAVLSQIKLVSTTPRTITKKTELRQECERIVANGYSTDYGEADEGIHCVAAPIFEANGSAVGAIWVSGPSKRIPKSSFSELGLEVLEAGARISRLIGELA